MNQQGLPATSAAYVLIWDCTEAPTEVGGEVWSWRHYSDGSLSVPRYLEQHAERLRARYVGFIHDLGQTVVNGHRIVEHMSLPDGFSFWWMTLLAEKSPLKSTRIYDALRLLALEEMLIERSPNRLVLRSADRALVTALRRLCANLGIAFQWEVAPDTAPQRGVLRTLYRKLPHPLRGLISIARQILLHWPLRKLEKPAWFAGRDTIFLCSYFVHLDAESCAKGRFHSHQWEQLPAHVHAYGLHTNWIQHFLFSPTVPDAATGIGWVRDFNRDAEHRGKHVFLDTYLSVSVVLAALKNWVWLNLLSLRLRKMSSAFNPAGSAASLWPLLKHDWLSSVRGTVAAGNCLWLALFERALKTLPHQETGLYIFENQAWERAFLHAWKRHGHGEIIGVQHATAPFWHLYYFDDPRSLRRDVPQPMPQADRIAVNGPAAARAFVDSGYAAERLVEVEALRYLGLASLASRGAAERRLPKVPLRVLILGDMIESSMHHLLRMVEGAAISVGQACCFTFKPHPYFPVSLTLYPGVVADVTVEPLHRILPDYDIAIAANSTSAAVDAYVAGLAVIIGLDGSSLNLSPLRGQPDVAFVSEAAELVGALRASPQQAAAGASAGGTTISSDESARDNFFFLDTLLSRWTNLLSLKSPGRERPRAPSLPLPIPQ